MPKYSNIVRVKEPQVYIVFPAELPSALDLRVTGVCTNMELLLTSWMVSKLEGSVPADAMERNS